MRFEAQINTADGAVRYEQFDYAYDARSVLAEHVNATMLQPGESLRMGDPPRDGADRRKEQIPLIERIQ